MVIEDGADGSMIFRKYRFLVIEDSLGDIRIMKKAFELCLQKFDFEVVRDGGEALEHIRSVGSRMSVSLPDLILLDMNLPKYSGLEVLVELRASKILSTVPVVVLSTSTAEVDILTSYEARANCYIQKPSTFEEWINLARRISEFWLGTVHLPQKQILNSKLGSTDSRGKFSGHNIW